MEDLIIKKLEDIKKYDTKQGHKPILYDDGRRYQVHGTTGAGDSYGVKFMGENPFNDPSKYGETEDGLLDKIRQAAERSSQNIKNGYGTTHGVIVVNDNIYITPKPGVEVIRVSPEPLEK